MNEENYRLDDKGDEGAVFDLSLKDEDLLKTIKKPLEDSETYWNVTYQLTKIRQQNLDMWLPNHWKGKEVFDYQGDYLYQDNRIFTSVETIVSTVNARVPSPDVMPAQDTIVSEQAANDLQKALFAHSDKHRTVDIFRVGTRNLILKRLGVVKLRWDKDFGANGDIVPEHVPPEDLIVDKDARLYDVPRYIAQRIRDKTVEELVTMFPDAEQKIFEMAGMKRRDKKGNLVAYSSQMAKQFDIYEIWFLHIEEVGEKKEKRKVTRSSVAWVDVKFQHVLGKMRNPNWNYEDELDGVDEQAANLLDMPMPPFFAINGFLNDGTSYIDQTTLVEQATPLQNILDKRGFQVVDNSEQAGSGMVFNTSMIRKEEIAKLIGAPDEKIGVKGDVRAAFARIPPPMLPNYVLEDKIDARHEIDNIFATHEVTRGQQSKNKTLGQDELQLQANLTRMDDIARAIERAASAYYKYLAQMMKVYYTEDHYFKVTGEDGQFDYIVLKDDHIEDGTDVRVEAGSTLPIDKNAQRQWAETLASMGMIDPLSLYEVGIGGTLPSPKKMLERYMTFVTDPMAFSNKITDDEFDRKAFLDIQVLIRGEVPQQRDDITPQYLKMFTKYMSGGEFQKQPEIIKQLFAEFLKVAQAQAQKQLQAMMTQMPTEEEMMVSNQKAVEQSQMDQQVAPQEPQGQPQEELLPEPTDQPVA